MTATATKTGRRITESDVTEGLRVVNAATGWTGTLSTDPATGDIFEEGDELGWDEETMGPLGVYVAWDGRYSGYVGIDALRSA